MLHRLVWPLINSIAYCTEAVRVTALSASTVQLTSCIVSDVVQHTTYSWNSLNRPPMEPLCLAPFRGLPAQGSLPLSNEKLHISIYIYMYLASTCTCTLHLHVHVDVHSHVYVPYTCIYMYMYNIHVPYITHVNLIVHLHVHPNVNYINMYL